MVTSRGTTANTKQRLRVLMVESDLADPRTIEQEFSQAGVLLKVAPNLAAAREILRETRLDVVVVDMFLPDGRGESLLPNIEACARQPGVIIVSQFLGDLQLSALEYRPALMAKPLDTFTLLAMIRTIAHGYFHRATERFVQRFRLSRRESEAVTLIARGFKAKEVSSRMLCSEKTVYTHLLSACAKTSSCDYHELVGKLLAFACHELGHTPSEYVAFACNEGEEQPSVQWLAGEPCSVDSKKGAVVQRRAPP